MSKSRISLSLKDDEIAIVGTLPRWQHLILTYEAIAQDYSDPEEKAAWLNAADWVREGITKAGFSDDGEWK
jgi:hypothetical protein